MSHNGGCDRLDSGLAVLDAFTGRLPHAGTEKESVGGRWEGDKEGSRQRFRGRAKRRRQANGVREAEIKSTPGFVCGSLSVGSVGTLF